MKMNALEVEGLTKAQINGILGNLVKKDFVEVKGMPGESTIRVLVDD